MARLLIGAFGDPGHAFPVIALGRELLARGHDVHLQTWPRWRAHIEAEGMQYANGPRYRVFPTPDRPLKPYQEVVHAARQTLALVEELQVDAVVADILTLAPALAAEMAGVPFATLVPHVHPHLERTDPPFSMGARRPRTALGRRMWAHFTRLEDRGLEQGRVELNGARTRLGLPELDRFHGGLSPECVLVGTFPHLEYPRPGARLVGGGSAGWAPNVHVVGPLLWEPPAEDVELPPGDDPLVVVAPSTAQDREHVLLRATLEGLADLPVRVLATWNKRLPAGGIRVPANARLVEWISYSRTMSLADVVVLHAGHGTLVRALASGAAVVAVPAAGDMNENAARADWAGVGVRLPSRLARPGPVRLAVEKALSRPALRARAQELAAWAARRSGAERAADVLEGFVAARAAQVPAA